MWGQVSNVVGGILGIRIIPMRVGTRLAKKSLDAYAEDHPHACGDKQINATNYHRYTWIIPMRVGTRYLTPFQINATKDHPHACGDKTSRSGYLASSSGSSPCVWGQEIRSPSNHLLTRIIPMRVGTSTAQILAWRTTKDHPHACGDKLNNHLKAHTC